MHGNLAFVIVTYFLSFLLPEHFNGLTCLRQERLLQRAGVPLDTIENKTTRKHLYQVDGSYVIGYYTVQANSLAHYCAFADLDPLEHFLEKSEIDRHW